MCFSCQTVYQSDRWNGCTFFKCCKIQQTVTVIMFILVLLTSLLFSLFSEQDKRIEAKDFKSRERDRGTQSTNKTKRSHYRRNGC